MIIDKGIGLTYHPLNVQCSAMSEADNPTNSAFPEPVNSVNSTKADQANLSSLDSPNETLAPVIVPTSQAENPHSVNFTAFSSWIEATENGMAVIAPSALAELIELIEEVHSSNSNLLQRVSDLTQALGKCQKALQSHKKRSHVAESMLTQQTQELAVAQEQVKCLSHELEATQQTAQRQQILIETLTAQLESSQERVAQLERECSFTQASYNEQSHALVQTENTCRELRTRLIRQQRHTLQFKVALEKCLEVSVPNYQSQADTERQSRGGREEDVLQSYTGNFLINPPPSADLFPPVTTRPLRDLRKPEPPFLPKVQPIPPWSAQPQFLTHELEPAWDSPLSSTPPTTWAESSASLFTADSSFFEWSAEDLSTPAEEEPLATVETDNSTPQESGSLVTTCSQQPPQAVLQKAGQTFEEQLDAVMQMFFDPPPSPPPAESSEPTIDLEELHPSESDTSEAEEAQWQDLVSLLEALEEPVTANSPDNSPEVATVPPRKACNPPAQLYEPGWRSEDAPRHMLDTGSEQMSPDQTNQFQLTSSPQMETSHFTANTNWPSAVVYPLRPPKGRKSLAEIELPRFA